MLRPLAAYVPGAEPDRWVAGGEGWRIEKRYTLEDNALVVSFRVEGTRLPSAIETEINLAMPSCDGFGGRYVLAAARFKHSAAEVRAAVNAVCAATF